MTSQTKEQFMHDWYAARAIVRERFQKRPDINAFLFLIGMNELQKLKDNYSKEEKQDLMHVGLCCLFESDGYFEKTQVDADGWPHYKSTDRLPSIPLREQEEWIKERIVRYFRNKGYIT